MTPTLCTRCRYPLPPAPPGGVCPGCGSRVGDTPQGATTPATAAAVAAAAPAPSFTGTLTAGSPADPGTHTAPGDGAAPPAAPAPVLPSYDDLTPIGSGGMGVVYRAVQRGTERVVAVKFLHGAGALDAGQVARFHTEAKALARVRHPNIVQIYEVGADAGRPYFSMEFCPGGTLTRRLREAPVAPRDAARIVAAAAEAVAAAHAAGVLHRDIKPGNVMLAEDGTPKVTDFGLAKFGDRDDGLTAPGALLGTPSYMAPEQARGDVQAVGERTDVYGLGATLYELLCGAPPFKGQSQQSTLQLVQTAEVAPPGRVRPGVPAELEAVCLKCLEKDPAKRYGSAREVADELHRWLAGEPTRARPLSRWGKLRRWGRRHRVALAVAVLLPLAAAAVLLAAAAARREADPLRQMTRALDRGEPVVLVPATGPPRWHRWARGEVALTASDAGDGTCGFQTHTMSLLELCPDPRADRYRFSAEFQHVKARSDNSVVGVWLGCPGATEADGVRRERVLAVQFNDFWRKADEIPKQRNLHGVQLRSYLFTQWPEKSDTSAKSVRNFPFAPAHQLDPPAKWRRVDVEVSPAGLQVFWRLDDGTIVPIYSVTVAELAAQAESFFGPGVPVVPPAPAWGPRGPLGVFATDSAVGVRKVTLTPLGAGP